MLCLRAPWLKCFAQMSSGCFDPELCPCPCPASSTAQEPSTEAQSWLQRHFQHWPAAATRWGPRGFYITQAELKTAFDCSVSCVKFLLAYNLSDSRNTILQYPTTCRVMYGATVILHSLSGEHFQASRLWSVLGLCRCFKMGLNVMVSVLEHSFCPEMSWAPSWNLLNKGPNARSKIVTAHKDQWIQELLQISNWG